MAQTVSLPARRARALALLALACTGLAACRHDRVDATGSLPSDDPRLRHPYVLADKTRTLDVFPAGQGPLDPRQVAEIDAFVLEYRRYGHGALALDVPKGVAPNVAASVAHAAGAVRTIVGEGGVPNNAIAVSGYPVVNPALAAPLRLSFQRMQAKVADECGLWPQDLGTSNFAYDQSNRSSWNLGCATRSNIAAQVVDPVDLVRGREEGRVDTVRRTQVINKLREGKDPSTEWRQDGKASVKDAVQK